MAKLTENPVEQLAMERLAALGYTTLAGNSDAVQSLRGSLQSPLLQRTLQTSIIRLNPHLPPNAHAQAYEAVRSLKSGDLLSCNEAFHSMLVNGVPVTYRKDGEDRGDLCRLVDFDTPGNNTLQAVNQFTFVEQTAAHKTTKRPDIILFINGLPLVDIELKNPADENATLHAAWRQIQTYKAAVPTLMQYNSLLVVSDGLEARSGSLSADYSRFLPWKSVDGITRSSDKTNQLETLFAGQLRHDVLLDLIRFFTVFEKTRHKDASGQISIQTIKKTAAYQQYYAVNKAVASTLRAGNRPEGQPGRGGVVWHTTGSGKSLSMVFFSAKSIHCLKNPTVVVLTDRNDLDDQLFGTFAAASALLRQKPQQANTRQDLDTLLRRESGGVIFSTMQKFRPIEGSTHEMLSGRRNILVLADEAHRTQYGFKAREREIIQDGKTVGMEKAYGLAKYLRDALPNAVYVGFTGTPIEKSDANTYAVFGDKIDVYDIAQSVEDGATVEIFYESRLIQLELPEEGKQLIAQLDEELDSMGQQSQTEAAKSRRSRLEALIGSNERQNTIARDIIEHFAKRNEVFSGKGMIVCMSRAIAVGLYNRIVALRPEWHSDDLAHGAIKVVMTSSSADGEEFARFQTTKKERENLAQRFKDPDDPLRLVIVCDMWLTGFDVPCLHTMYLDKPLRGHTLIQTISRVNRVWGDKPGGLIVDYLGVAGELEEALGLYSSSGGTGDLTTAQEQAVELVREKLDVIKAMLHGFGWQAYLTADTASKLNIILAAEDFILGLEDGKKRYCDAVSALSAAYALAIPKPEALEHADEIAFFQAVRARLVKFAAEPQDGREEIESVIKQVIDRALVTNQVIDIYDAAGIQKPNISVLSDQFMQQMRSMEHKNIAFEVLRRLIAGEIRDRSRTRLLESKTLLDRLESTLKKYHNKIITAAELIDELIKLGQEVRDSDKTAQEMGLHEYEYAFYLAVADNESARELMGKEKLRELATVLTQKVRKTVTLDWTIKSDVKAQLRVIIARTLKQYGYPPDMEKLATETVMQQAELIADSLVVDPL